VGGTVDDYLNFLETRSQMSCRFELIYDLLYVEMTCCSMRWK